MAKAQKGKQTTPIHLADMINQLNRFISCAATLREQFERSPSSFSSRVKRWMSSQYRQQRVASHAERRKRKEQEDREIKRAIANRLLKEVLFHH